MLEDVLTYQTPVQVSTILRMVSMLWHLDRWHTNTNRGASCPPTMNKSNTNTMNETKRW
jgi:hypothetical protein